MSVFTEKMAELKQQYICIKVTLKWGKCCGNFWSTQSSFVENTLQRGLWGPKGCIPLNIPNAMEIRQWGKEIKMSIQWRNFSLKQLKLSPWFCWQDKMFILLSKESERQYVGALKHMYSCWLRMRRTVWTCARIFSSDEMSFNRLCPLYCEISTADKNIFRTIVLPGTHPWQWPQLCVTAEKGWIKVTKYNFYTSGKAQRIQT